MEQRITDSVEFKKCHKINEQFLHSLVDILKSNNDSIILLFEIFADRIVYSFESVEDLINSSLKIIKPINKICISAKYPVKEKKYCINEIKLSFSNYRELFQTNSTEIKFNFYSDDDYIILKNRIETLLKNYTLSYSILSRIPIIAICTICIFFGICIYTKNNHIIYPKEVQHLIIVVSFLMIIWSIFNISPFNFFERNKRLLFPLNEFEFGTSINSNKKASTLRQIIGIGIILTFIVGLLINYTSSRLF
ncbi:MAG: hypothetical protein VB018_02190 [Lachnospiraceae bacterium]|nr:hypothetical protein [Lachnospiraceae bacterium]